MIWPCNHYHGDGVLLGVQNQMMVVCQVFIYILNSSSVLLLHSRPADGCLSGLVPLQVRNLMLDTTEETLRHEFSHFKPGSVERVKKLADYAFVHYRCRSDAVTALSLMNGAQIDGATVEVTLAKPAVIKDGGGGAGRRCSRGSMGNLAAGGRGAFDSILLLPPSQGMMGGTADGRSLFRAMPLTTSLGNPYRAGAAGRGTISC